MTHERQEILDAALDEFARVGLPSSSLNSIADGANLEPGAVRALFVDKATLLNELLKEKAEPMVSAIALLVEETENPKELLRKSLQFYDQWLLTHPDVVRLLVRCLSDGPGALHSFYKHLLLPSEFFERLENMIDRQQLRCNDVFILALLFDSLILLPHMMRSTVELLSPEQTAEQIFQQRFEAAMDLLENGLYSEQIKQTAL